MLRTRARPTEAAGGLAGRVLVGLAALVPVGAGLWAMLASESFYSVIAPLEQDELAALRNRDEPGYEAVSGGWPLGSQWSPAAWPARSAMARTGSFVPAS